MKKKAAVKELKTHIKDVKEARTSLKKETGHLKSSISKKITGALKQDHRVLKDID